MIEPVSATLGALGTGLKTKFVGKVVEVAIRHPLKTLDFCRAWSMGPHQPAVQGETLQAPGVAGGIYGFGNFLQTAHCTGSPATAILLADDVYLELQDLVEEHEDLADKNDFTRLSLTYRTATLALGLYSVVRFGDRLLEVPSATARNRSDEVLHVADRLFASTSGFVHQTRDYDKLFAMANSRSGDVLQLLNECTVVRALAHRRFDPNFPRVAKPLAVGDPALWSLTRLNGIALESIAALRDESASTGNVDHHLRAVIAANRMITSEADKTNHRFQIYRSQPALQASQSVYFAKGYGHLLTAICLLINDWDAPLSSRDAIRVRNAIAAAEAAYGAGPDIWWHSYANAFVVWALLMYRCGRTDRYRNAIATACRIYRNTNDESRVARIEHVMQRSRHAGLTRMDAIDFLT